MKEQQDSRKGKVNMSTWVDPALRTRVKVHTTLTDQTSQEFVAKAIEEKLGRCTAEQIAA